MNEKFLDWLNRELGERSWSKSELARKSGRVPSTVSKILNGQNKPGIDFCVGVAQAFGYPPEVVLRKAGIIPIPPSEKNPRYRQLIEIASYLESEELENAVEYLSWRLQLQEKRKSSAGQEIANHNGFLSC